MYRINYTKRISASDSQSFRTLKITVRCQFPHFLSLFNKFLANDGLFWTIRILEVLTCVFALFTEIMVTVNEAKQKILETVSALPAEIVEIRNALGHVLADNILSPMSLPSFRQSSMDGYAIIAADVVEKDTTLQLAGESKAGQTSTLTVTSGKAIRIFTGAPVPDGATAVIMQENTAAEDGNVTIREFPVATGKNIRNVGQQIKEGATALEKGTFLSPGSIGFLQGMNVWEANVHRKPKIGLLITGDELLHKGDSLVPGKIFESNSAMLAAALQQEGIADLEIKYAEDDLESTIQGLSELTENNDVVLASGGISVGDYDFVGKALAALGAETIFYKVRQKPGKPLLFAKKQDKLFFALPGNPASSLVCFYEYVLPALRIMSGRKDPFLTTLKLPSKYAYSFDGERDEFLKGLVTHAEVIPLDGQESFALRSFAIANAIIYLPVSQNVVKVGDLVEVHLLPF